MAESDRSSLLSLLLHHYGEITDYLTRRLGSVSAAQDVAQDAYVRLRDAATVPEVLNARSYLYRLADNLALDHLRATSRRDRREVRVDAAIDRAAEQPDAESALEYKQRLALLARAVDDLPPRCREVFLLHKVEGLSHGEIARRLGISRSMVEKHVMKALAHCRDRVMT